MKAKTKPRKAKRKATRRNASKPALSIPSMPPIPPMSQQIHTCPAADVIVDEGFNTRNDFGDIDGLAASIATYGIIQPGHCWIDAEGRPHLNNGERRFKGLCHAIAAGLLPGSGDPRAQFRYLVCEKPLSDAERTELMLDLNSGKPFTFSESARAYARIVTGKKGWTAEEVARRRGGISSAHIRNYLAFMELVAPELHAAVDSGECTATLALDLARALPEKAAQAEAYADGRKYAIEQRASRGDDGEGGEIHVTARHLAVPTGKSPGRNGAARSGAKSGTSEGVPFKDVQVNGGTDHKGQLWTHDKEPIAFPRECAVKGAVLIGTVGDTFRAGWEAKWPGVRKDDGRLRELPAVDGTPFRSRGKAVLHALMQLRGDIEGRDFADTRSAKGADRRRIAVDFLSSLIDGGAEQRPLAEEGGSGDDEEESGVRSQESGDSGQKSGGSTQPPASRQKPASGNPPPDDHPSWPAAVLYEIQELVLSLGPKLDQDASALATVIATACLGKYDIAHVRKTLASQLSK